MTNETPKSGFWGTEAEVYYLNGRGRAWVVVSQDDIGTGSKEIDIADLPDELTSCEGLVTPEEAAEYLSSIDDA